MKKSLLIPITFLLLFLALPVFAEDDSGWDSVYKDYSKTENIKPVTNQDFEAAVKTREKYNNKGKKKKKGEKEEEPKVTLDSPSSTSPLLMLAENVNYNGKIIPQGFYLVETIKKDDAYYLRLTQGTGHIVAEIEANVINNGDVNTSAERSVYSEITQNNSIKITYYEKNLVLEAYLY